MAEHHHEHDHAYMHAHGIAHEHGHVHENQKAVINRLARAIGHLEKVKRMVEEGHDCSEVLIQLAAVRSALDNTGKVILMDHMRHCMVDAVTAGDTDAIDDLCLCPFERLNRGTSTAAPGRVRVISGAATLFMTSEINSGESWGKQVQKRSKSSPSVMAFPLRRCV